MKVNGRTVCALCWEPIEPRGSWLTRLIFGMPPVHRSSGPEADACWRGFNERLGLDPDRPKPRV